MFIKNGSYKKHTHIISYVPPTIITQPLSATKNVGDNNIFFVSAKGSKPLNYQWYKNTSSLIGLTSNQINLTNLQLTDDAEYYCEVSNHGYSIQSNIVKLTVVDSLSFVTQPSSVEANPNSNIFFSVSVTTASPITYKWYKNSLLYPANTDIIYINSVTEKEEGTYYCVVSNLLTSITSLSAELKVNDPVVIIEQPVDTSSLVGNNITFNLSCVGTLPITAQWRKDNTNYGSLSVTNDGDVKLEINNVQTLDEGNYDCVLSNLVGSVTSNKALFYINKPPEFILNPVSGIGYRYKSFTFFSNATGTNPLYYQWIKENEGSIVGASFKNYKISNLQISNSGNYACIVSNLYSSATSTFAYLSVLEIEKNNFKIAVGDNHSYAIGIDGTLSAWGNNLFGQLGDNTLINKLSAIEISTAPIYKIFAGGYHTLAIGIDDTLSAWGWNEYGQLGDGTKTNRSTPVKISLPTVDSLSIGFSHTLAVGIDEILSAWGDNTYGQLGDGTRINRNTPVKINLPPVFMVAVGNNHSLALGTNKTLSAWGNNNYGQLGNGTYIDSIDPIKIDLPLVSIIESGKNHSLAVGIDGTLSAWGYNFNGQLGDGTTNNRSTPVKIDLPPIVMLATGNNHTLALGTDGTLSAWGDNTYGQLGDGTTINRPTPVKINLPSISMIKTDSYHTLALGTDGTLSAWGDNTYGQLGDGTTINRPTPVKINLPLIF